MGKAAGVKVGREKRGVSDGWEASMGRRVILMGRGSNKRRLRIGKWGEKREVSNGEEDIKGRKGQTEKGKVKGGRLKKEGRGNDFNRFFLVSHHFCFPFLSFTSMSISSLSICFSFFLFSSSASQAFPY